MKLGSFGDRGEFDRLAENLQNLTATHCVLPLPEHEVAAICASVARYPSTPVTSKAAPSTANGADLTFCGLTLTRGNATGNGGAVVNSGNSMLTFVNVEISQSSATQNGGGIFNALNGSLLIQRSNIRNNTATLSGGALSNADVSGTINIQESTLSGNTAGTSGGAIEVGGNTVTLFRSTVSGNTAATNGGGIDFSNGFLNLDRSTISGNIAQTGQGGGLYRATAGSLIFPHLNVSRSTITDNLANSGGYGIHTNMLMTIAFVQSIIGNQRSGGPDCSNNALSNLQKGSYNLDSDGPCLNPLTGTDATFASLLLSPLADNGGLTQTHALQLLSPAVNRITNGLCGVGIVIDQRGFPRPATPATACDTGSFER